jgi:SNF2 family DNA or RNA helicase
MADDLTQRIEALEAQLTQLQEEDTPLVDQKLDTTNKQLTKLTEKKQDLEKQKQQLRQQHKNLELEVKQLKQQQNDQQKAQEAEEALNRLTEKFDATCQGEPWYDSLFDFQRDDVLYSLSAYDQGLSGILNANIMGSGKTIEAIAAYTYMKKDFFEQTGREPKTLWLTKKSAMKSTFNEWSKWSNELVVPLLADQTQQKQALLNLALNQNSIVITNYESLNSLPDLIDTTWDFVFADEVHKLKNGHFAQPPQVFRNVRSLLGIEKYGFKNWQKTRHTFFYPLTGTPIQNHPKEVWSYLHLFRPDLFSSVKDFEVVFSLWGKIHFEKLSKTLAGQLLRQDPETIKAQRPNKDRQFIYLQHTHEQSKTYESIKQGILDSFEKQAEDDPDKELTITSILAQLTRLRQANIWPPSVKDPYTNLPLQPKESSKIDEALEIIEQLVLHENEQVVVWSSQFTDPLIEIQNRVHQLNSGTIRCERLDGSNPDPQATEHRFQQRETQVIVANMKSGGEALNLNKSHEWPGGASRAIFLDLWYNPAVNEQAEDRLHRNTSTENVELYVLFNEDSVDNFIAGLLEEKEKQTEGITDSGKLLPTKEWLAELQNKL